MKAIGIKNGKGNADAFFIEDDVADPTAKSGYIIVGIKAFGLNRMDIMQREDKYPYPLLPESGKILGVEFSGTVLEKGPDCTLSCIPVRQVDKKLIPPQASRISKKAIESSAWHMEVL